MVDDSCHTAYRLKEVVVAPLLIVHVENDGSSVCCLVTIENLIAFAFWLRQFPASNNSVQILKRPNRMRYFLISLRVESPWTF